MGGWQAIRRDSQGRIAQRVFDQPWGFDLAIGAGRVPKGMLREGHALAEVGWAKAN